jgi:hypothetical protein
MKTQFIACLALLASVAGSSSANADEVPSTWIDATDETQVNRIGDWRSTSFRYAHASHLQTSTPGAALDVRFQGTGIAIRLGNNAVPAYGSPNLGRILARIDGGEPKIIEPRSDALEVVLARGLPSGEHRLRIEHQPREDGSGCRVEGFHVFDSPTGDLQFTINGEDDAFLVEARAIVTSGERVVRNTLVRNWLNGRCRLVSLPPGNEYAMTLSAVGWRSVTVKDITVAKNAATTLPAVYLTRDPAARSTRFRFPALNRPAIRQPNQSFHARFHGYRATIEEVKLTRSVGPAVISRKLRFEEDKTAAFYYDREVVAHLPADMPPGLYDLSVTNSWNGRRSIQHSHRSVHVVHSFPTDPVFVTFGHLDTSSQYQAEYLQRVATMANLIGPDLVLNSNAVNPAYISGALTRLEVPYVVNFGNHRFHGHEKWYGDQVGMIDFGPDVCVLNFGHPWHTDRSRAEALLSARKSVACKIINAFEQNAPPEFLDRHGVRMIHDAHGTGDRVMNIGETPTVRVGKVNAVSFRVVRFENTQVASCTYGGHETDPIPFGREELPPLRSTITPANDGTHESLVGTVTNDYIDEFPNCRLTFVLPPGDYAVERGRIESTIVSDGGRYTVLTVRCDVPARKTITVRVNRQALTAPRL